MSAKRITYRKTCLPALPSLQRMSAMHFSSPTANSGAELASRYKISAERIARYFQVDLKQTHPVTGSLFGALSTVKPGNPRD